MARRTSQEPIVSDAGLAQSRKTSPILKSLLRDQHGLPHRNDSVREAHYKGHHIVIKTTYEVTVDGKKFHADLAVTNSGNVGYHGMPNVGFASAIDLMQSVIDQFPDDFKKTRRRSNPAHREHDSHTMHTARRSKKSTRPRRSRLARRS